MSLITIKNLTKSYNDDSKVLNNIDLEVNEGEFVVLLGASGCGKTTLLKIINGLIGFDSGDVSIYDKSIKDWDGIDLRRKIGYVIQNVGLFPHLSVSDNISYVLSLENVPKNTRKERARELLKLVRLDEKLLNRYPHELSGGQKQRVGVARALANNPKIILMDEPFGAVDEIARTALQDEFLEINKILKKTIIFVTHDIYEAQKLGSRIVLIKDGEILQDGSKFDLQFKPKNEYVKEFFGVKGFKNFLDNKKMSKVFDDIVKGNMNLDDLF